MKKLVLLTMIALMAVPCFGDATRFNIQTRPTADWLTGSMPNKDPAWAWMKAIDIIVGGTGVNQGNIYYVDNNSGADTQDGLSWSNAVLTITKALELSHLNIATSPNYADRNKIFVRGDDFDEDWTDLAQKTDVVGVGSDDGNKGPRILGNHVIDAVASSYNYMGCRFINMTFVNQTAADIFVVPTGHHGLEWIGCRFESNSSTLAPSALDITQCSDTRIVGCEFISSVNPMWSGGAIDFGAGLCQNTDILYNFIDAAIGITIDSGATGLSSRIEGNTIYASTLTIDDNSDVFYVCNNSLISDTYGKVAFDFYIPHAQGNMLTTPVRTTPIPYTNECAGAVAAAQRGAFGTIYYVDRNMAATGGDGLTWETACQSLKTAMAKSHANIGVSAQRGWAQRNTIYMRGDVMTEDHIVLAQKTDIVGVGSSNVNDRPYVIGTWVIPNTDSWMGCHFYNLYFKDDGAGGVLFKAALQGGLQFHNCAFEAAATDTIAIELTNCDYDIKIDNCDFLRVAGASFSTAAITIVDGASAFTTGITISNNRIYSDGIGVDWNEQTDVFDCWIRDNFFRTATMCVDSDDTVGLMVANNYMVTLVEPADDTGNNFNIAYAVNNMVTGASSTLYIPTYSDD